MATTENDSNFNEFFRITKKSFRFLGIELKPSTSYAMKFLLYWNIYCMMQHLIQLLQSVGTARDLNPRVLLLWSGVSYSLIAKAKIWSFLFRMPIILNCLQRFEAMHPSKAVQAAYNLKHYEKYSLWLQKCLIHFLELTLLAFHGIPFGMTLIECIKTGKLSLQIFFYEFRYPFDIESSTGLRLLVYIQQIWISYIIGLCTMTCDLVLLSLVILVCIQLDLLSKRIMEINAEQQNAEQQFIELMQHYIQVSRYVFTT